MMAQINQLMVLSIGLAGLAAFELAVGPFFVPSAPQSVTSSDVPEAAQAVSHLAKPDISKFSEVVERPLFMRSRRPPEASVDVSDEVRTSAFDLVGIIVSQDKRVALLRPSTSKKVMRAVEGQHVEGWEVIEIRATEITLARGNSNEIIKITETRRKPTASKGRVSSRSIKKLQPNKKSQVK